MDLGPAVAVAVAVNVAVNDHVNDHVNVNVNVPPDHRSAPELVEGPHNDAIEPRVVIIALDKLGQTGSAKASI